MIAIVVECQDPDGVLLGGNRGAIFWPLMKRLALLERSGVRIFPLHNMPVTKATHDELLAYGEGVRASLANDSHEFSRVLLIGPKVTEALLGDRYTNMRAVNACHFTGGLKGYTQWTALIPCMDPSMALAGGGIEDPLAWTAHAIMQLTQPKFFPKTPVIPEAIQCTMVPEDATYLAIDTEGTPEQPICITWAVDGVRAIVFPEDAQEFWDGISPSTTIVYQNAPWDWSVLEALGIDSPERHRYVDTMELAYLKHCSPQGLKDLAWRHLRIRMKPWTEVVMPHYDAHVKQMAEFIVAGGTSIQTHSEKTGKPLKKPKVTRTKEILPIYRALNNPKLLAKRMSADEPSLLYVPYPEMTEYATLDPFATLHLYYALRGVAA